MKKIRLILAALVLLAILPFSVSAGNGEEETDIPSLSETFAGYFPIGNIMSPDHISSKRMEPHFLYHYNSVTAENSMKPEAVASQKGRYSFIIADMFVNWALENDVKVHGHTLVWHQQSPNWMTKDDDGSPLTRAEARENMESFITGYAGYFSGRVSSWDVVNEAFTDSVSNGTPWKNALRKDSPWYMAYANGMDESAGEAPEDYIYDAFVFTRLAAPDALLFYNDFNDEERGKSNAMAEMAEELNSKWLDDDRNNDKERLLVEVIGMQAHYWTDNLNADNVRSSVERFIATGAKVAVTELDIPMGSYNNFKKSSDEQRQKQAELYKSLFEIYMDYSEHIVRVTFWGKADHQSWRSAGSPLLFDGKMQPKPAFWEVIELVLPAETEIIAADDITPREISWWVIFAANIAITVLVVICAARVKKKEK